MYRLISGSGLVLLLSVTFASAGEGPPSTHTQQERREKLREHLRNHPEARERLRAWLADHPAARERLRARRAARQPVL